MGLRGPLRQPDSIRGRKEGLKVIKAPVGDPAQLNAPAWLSRDQKRIFAELHTELQAAQVPLQRLDAFALGMAAKTLHLASKEKDPKLFARLGRDAMAWLSACGGTVKSRAQMGVRPTTTGAISKAEQRRDALKTALFIR